MCGESDLHACDEVEIEFSTPECAFGVLVSVTALDDAILAVTDEHTGWNGVLEDGVVV